MANKQFTVPEDIAAITEGYVGKLRVDFEVKPTESDSQMTKTIK